MTEGCVELHSASAFSFLEGIAAGRADQARRRVADACDGIARSERCLWAARFHTSAKRNGVRAHIGAEIAVTDLGTRLTPPDWLPHQHLAEPCRVSLLCESRAGYQNLCRLTTRFKLQNTNMPVHTKVSTNTFVQWIRLLQFWLNHYSQVRPHEGWHRRLCAMVVAAVMCHCARRLRERACSQTTSFR
jgi:DNA polymerase III alpha subunit